MHRAALRLSWHRLPIECFVAISDNGMIQREQPEHRAGSDESRTDHRPREGSVEATSEARRRRWSVSRGDCEERVGGSGSSWCPGCDPSPLFFDDRWCLSGQERQIATPADRPNGCADRSLCPSLRSGSYGTVSNASCACSEPRRIGEPVRRTFANNFGKFVSDQTTSGGRLFPTATRQRAV